MEYIQLSPTSRLAIEYDDNAPNPREWMEPAVGCFTPNPIFGPRINQGPLEVFTFPGDLSDAHDRLSPLANSWEPEHLVQRWAWANYNIHVELRGWTYWFCDKDAFEQVVGGEFTRDAQKALIQDESTMYQRWLSGEARALSLQRLSKFRRITPKHNPLDRDLLRVWETVETQCGVYVDDNYTYADVTRECMSHVLNHKEETIIAAMLDQQRMDRQEAHV